MSAIRPKSPSTIGGHAGLATARVRDGCSTIRITLMLMVMVLVMTRAAAVTVGRPAHIMVPASDLTVRGQDDRAKGGGIGAANRNNGNLAWHRVGRRRLACSAMAGGQS